VKKTQLNSDAAQNRCGWQTLNVKVLLGNNGIESYKADARRHKMRWSDYISWAIRDFSLRLLCEDKEKSAKAKQAVLDFLSAIKYNSRVSLN
jgi:hypothetical protein